VLKKHTGIFLLWHNKRMKFLSLFLIAFLLVAPAVYAQSESSKPAPSKDESSGSFLGKLFGGKDAKPPAPTPKQMDEAFAVYDECKASDMVRKYYDCNCLAENFLNLRAADTDTPRDELIVTARKKCPNTVDIAGSSYQRCLDWAPRLRADYDQYCTCYANTFAKNFTTNPTDSIRGREMIMTRALVSCNTTDEIGERRARDRMIDQLKKQGVYETLFPNVKTNSPEPETPQN